MRSQGLAKKNGVSSGYQKSCNHPYQSTVGKNSSTQFHDSRHQKDSTCFQFRHDVSYLCVQIYYILYININIHIYIIHTHNYMLYLQICPTICKTSSKVPLLLHSPWPQEAAAWSQLAEALPALGNEEELALRGEAKTARPRFWEKWRRTGGKMEEGWIGQKWLRQVTVDSVYFIKFQDKLQTLQCSGITEMVNQCKILQNGGSHRGGKSSTEAWSDSIQGQSRGHTDWIQVAQKHGRLFPVV